jgi:uncharacterized damage-inducible protein DinB
MNETERLLSLFEKLYDGSPWIDVNLVSTLEALDAARAGKRPLSNANTIWEIVNHLIHWRMNVLARVQGQVIQTPENNYFEPVADTSDQAWVGTLHRLEDSQKQWTEFLESLEAEALDDLYPANQMTYYEHMQGIIQHDAYHLGQIVLLSKLV